MFPMSSDTWEELGYGPAALSTRAVRLPFVANETPAESFSRPATKQQSLQAIKAARQRLRAMDSMDDPGHAADRTRRQKSKAA